ncbi:hypothetical protein EUBVEN_01804 [Eubacterium ventriosum ATCC 27560]|uniref:Uncharacterized protein n=1 Tax=Eubacterium ventriosum ATCC 27560 TaxID=411463 RepID=A5Z7W4_9FIRM|nr:hypothetical protein EUBVEN_01804 [Eubacterium ventriosum ATCC 27560]
MAENMLFRLLQQRESMLVGEMLLQPIIVYMKKLIQGQQ